jgi:glycogen operon protein
MTHSDCEPVAWALAEGVPTPLGASWHRKTRSWNFALYSKHATAVTLLIYGRDDCAVPLYRFPLNHLVNKSGRVWHCWVPEASVPGACYYAYTVDGPRDPVAGH